MSGLFPDIRFALRSMRKNPGFTAVAILTLALGLGANTAIFSFVDAVLLKPLPYSKPEEIVNMFEKPPGGGQNSISALNYLDWANQNTVFQNMAAINWGSVTFSGTGEPQELKTQFVSATYFDIFRTKAALGRTFLRDEDQPGKGKVIVLSNRIWQKHFGADPHIAGKVITVNQEPYTVLGVLPANSPYDRGWPEVWVPLVFSREQLTRDFHYMNAVGRLKPGISFEQARVQMDSIAGRIAKDYPNSNKGWGISMKKLTEDVTGSNLRQSLYTLLAAVAAVLLIGCTNLANLMLARSTARNREVAIRSALGAKRSRLLRQLLTESMLLWVLGGVTGVLLGYGFLHVLQISLPEHMIPSHAEVSLDWRVLLYMLGLTLLTGLIFGLGPALAATRKDVTESLKEGGRSTTSGVSRRRVRGALVVVEVALAFVLLAGAGLLIRSLSRLLDVNPGFETTNVLTMGLPLESEKNQDGVKLTNYLREIITQIQSVPGVREAAVTSALPLQGWGYGMPFLVAGGPFVDRANRRAGFFKMISPSYFRALGMKVRKGRGLLEADVAGGQPVMVINETMEKRYFQKESPLGKQVLVQQIVPGKHELGPEVPWLVVGVVADEKVAGLNDDSPGMYVSYVQSPVPGMSLVIRGVGDPEKLTKAIQHHVWQVNKDQSLTNIRTLEQIKTESVASNRLQTNLLAVFAGLALLLASLGIYGVLSYSVLQRKHEMGVRQALGATAKDLLRLVVGEGIRLAGVGLLLGLLGAFALTRFIASLLYSTSAMDWVTMVSVAGILGTVALVACLIPARRAAKVDPMVTLRYE